MFKLKNPFKFEPAIVPQSDEHGWNEDHDRERGIYEETQFFAVIVGCDKCGAFSDDYGDANDESVTKFVKTHVCRSDITFRLGLPKNGC